MQLDRTTLRDVEELLEDTVSFSCDEYDLPSDALYKIMEVWAIKKQFELEQLQQTLNS